MSDENLRQRIRYLVEHGGLYPQDDRWPPWAKWLLAVSVLSVVVGVVA